MESSFHSDENKGVIWQLLSDNGAFNDISEKHFTSIRELFDNTFFDVNQITGHTLLNKNKLVMSEIMKKLMYFKSQKILPPLQEVKIDLDKALQTKEEEFIKLVKRPTPQEIDFLDNNKNIDEPIDASEMTLKLNNMINQRQTEFDMVPTSVNTQERETSSAKNDKKVSFTNNSFLNKIKQHDKTNVPANNNDNNNDNINLSVELANIQENQKVILRELESIKSLLLK